MKVRLSRIDPSLPLPRYETEGAVGFDLLARVETRIEPGKLALVPANIIVEVPTGYMLMVASRSSLPRKKNLLTPHGLGIIDHDYCGPDDEIHVQVYNFSGEPVSIARGEKIAQGVFVRVDKFEWEELDTMTKPSRGGFGSTGGYTRPRGALITLYGVNNIGKSTHARKLVERLLQSGLKAHYLKYPVYDLEPTGPRLNSILRHGTSQTISEEELQTLFMQNRRDFEPQLRAMIAEGTIVIAEDYTGTGIAWGMAKGLDQAWLETLNAPLLKEDLAILMTGQRDLRAKEAQHLHEKDDELVQSVASILRQLSDQYGWKILETKPKIADTAELLWETVAAFLRLGR